MDVKKFLLENFKIIFLGITFFISLTTATYIYTENTGYKGCLNIWAKELGYKNWKHFTKERRLGPVEKLSIRSFCEYAEN